MRAAAERDVQWPTELAAHRDFLRRLALMQMGSPFEADDVVQETLIAAATGLHGFTGNVPMRAWLVGILRHKIVDVMRRWQRIVPLDLSDDAMADGHVTEEMFTADGTWLPEALGNADGPGDRLDRQQLLELVELCMQALPPASARVFLLREYLGMEISEIATQTALSTGNLRVIMHRTRLRLRACVVRGWGEER